MLIILVVFVIIVFMCIYLHASMNDIQFCILFSFLCSIYWLLLKEKTLNPTRTVTEPFVEPIIVQEESCDVEDKAKMFLNFDRLLKIPIETKRLLIPEFDYFIKGFTISDVGGKQEETQYFIDDATYIANKDPDVVNPDGSLNQEAMALLKNNYVGIDTLLNFVKTKDNDMYQSLLSLGS